MKVQEKSGRTHMANGLSSPLWIAANLNLHFYESTAKLIKHGKILHTHGNEWVNDLANKNPSFALYLS